MWYNFIQTIGSMALEKNQNSWTFNNADILIERQKLSFNYIVQCICKSF